MITFVSLNSATPGEQVHLRIDRIEAIEAYEGGSRIKHRSLDGGQRETWVADPPHQVIEQIHAAQRIHYSGMLAPYQPVYTAPPQPIIGTNGGTWTPSY